MDGLRATSCGLYKVIGKKLGTKSIVAMRRTVMTLAQCLATVFCKSYETIEDKILSGSTCEGFRFSSSDIDFMCISRGIRVIFSSLYLRMYTSEHTVVLAECNNTKPGFALLRLMSDFSHFHLRDSHVKFNDNFYIASGKWRECFTTMYAGRSPERFRHLSPSPFVTHGPCSTTTYCETEVDHAFCVKADILPKSAHGFIRRLHRAGWPSAATLQRIATGGCHFVAIGAKESETEFLEWRISFSCTERILIHSMNHVQFSCYGLLKVFLKEALDENTNIKGLLCSYFLKTAVFWEIVDNELRWEPSNFLCCFWKCFQRLLQWINSEYCPNFFIPENNMFAGKIQGANRSRLLSHLVSLHKEGYFCLLRCRSIQNELSLIIHPPLGTRREERNYSEKCTIEALLITEIFNMHFGLGLANDLTLNSLTRRIQFLNQEISEHNDELRATISQVWKTHYRQIIGMILSTAGDSTFNAPQEENLRVKMIKESVFDATSHLVYAALYEYRSGRYNAALHQLHEAKQKLQHPLLLYPWIFCIDRYIAAGGNQKTFAQLMQEIVAWPIILPSVISLPELQEEHSAVYHHFKIDVIVLPPLVLVNFLFFLCNYRNYNVPQAISAQCELHDLLLHEPCYHIHVTSRAISWQILGICQEMNGDNQGAYQSYINALKQQWCPVRLASIVRLENICHHISV